METEQIRHQRYSASFSNNHKVVENYQYLTKKIRTNVCENLLSVISDKNDPCLEFLMHFCTTQAIVSGNFPSTLRYYRSTLYMHGPSLLISPDIYWKRKKLQYVYLGQLWIYYVKCETYTKLLNRKGLEAPGGSIHQWCIFYFIVFDKIRTCVCRKSLMGVFQDTSDHCCFSVHRCNCRILAIILINVFCKKINSRSIREAKQKVIKLSLDRSK